MAKIYMSEADFDDSDEWFHDGIEGEPDKQEINIEVKHYLDYPVFLRVSWIFLKPSTTC